MGHKGPLLRPRCVPLLRSRCVGAVTSRTQHQSIYLIIITQKRIPKSCCLQSIKFLTRTQNHNNHHKKSPDSVELTNQDKENMLTKIHDNKGSQRNEALQSVQLTTTAHHTGRKSIRPITNFKLSACHPLVFIDTCK